MKTSFNADPSPNRFRLGVTAFSPRTNTTNPLRNFNAKRWTTNYAKEHNASLLPNVFIIYLDATFETLGSTVKGHWNDASDAMAGWHICGCANQQMTGKKLFRQQNLTAVMNGIAPNLTPPSTTGWSLVQLTALTITVNPSPATASVRVQCTDPTPVTTCLFKPPYGGNFSIPLLVTDITFFSGAPFFASLYDLQNFSSVNYCTTTSTGLPSDSASIATTIITAP